MINVKETLREIINEALVELEIDNQGDFTVEIPQNKDFGDYSTNVAMTLAKTMKQNPLKIAEMIIEKINNENIKNIEIKPPGFINFFVKKSYLVENINNILDKGVDYGRSNIGNNEKTNVEFVSANPTGLLHVGTSRCAAYGDNLCRILSFCGYDVTREYYFNDGGVQIENLGKSLKARYENICGIETTFPENGYHGHEIIDIAKKLYEEYKDTKLEENLEYFSEYAANYLIKIIKEDLKDFRVSFDVWTSEQKFRKDGSIENALSKLKSEDNIYESEGAIWLKSTKYGDDKDRVLIKSDGNYTYLVPDIAYHLDKINRGYESIINVLGADHHGYISRLKASIEALNFDKDKIKIKLVQMVKLLRDKKEVKMSKRTGETVTMKELMEEVGVNAARYFLAARSVDSQMDFDISLATKKSNENPVYYVSYAYARICTMLKSINHNKKINEYTTLDNDEAYSILEKLYLFPEVVEEAALKELPHIITNYVYELANIFHTFYEKYRIITEDEIKTVENINLIKAVKITLENALNLIGVIPPEKM